MPTLSLMFNYQYSGMSDEFFRGETNYWYPTSLVGLNLRVPIFSGFSRRAKINQNSIEISKAQEDAQILGQSLNMAYLNARMKLTDALGTIELQADNQELAREVFNVAEKNYELGLSSMADILNASQSLVQAQLSYANALNDYMKACVELKKTTGSIRSLLNDNQQVK
jgi:outer membrane protein TolC